MARLTGLTIDIGGNTEKLNDALKNPTKNANELQGKLKEVNTALKLDPTNTELLSQKQKLLAESVDSTKEKLTLLKQAQKEFKDSGGDLNSKAYIQLEADIAKTEASLKSLESQQSKVNTSLQSMANKASDFGAKATALGKAFLPVTAGVTAFSAASVKSFSDVDNAVDTIAKKTGATGEAMNEFKDVFDDVATTIPADMNDVGAAIGEINTRLGFTGDELTEASEQFLKFADINETDVNTSVQLVTRAMGDAGMKSSEYGKMLDMLTKASQASGISIDKLTENITKYGAPMRSLGFDTASSIAIFSQWEKAGVNTEIAFSGMKKSISNFMKDGKDAKVEFANLISGIQDGSITAQEALDIFGTKAGPDLVDAIQQGRFSYEDFLKIIESSEGTVSATFDETQDGIDKMKTATNAGKIALAEFGEVISNALAPILQAVTTALRGFTNILQSMPPGMKEVIIVVGALVAAFGPVMMIVGQIANGISVLLPLLGNLSPLFTQIGTVATTAFELLKTVALGAFNAIMAHPIIAGITAIIAIIVALYTKCEWFRDAVNALLGQLWEGIKNVFETIKNFLFKTVPESIDGVISFFSEMPGGIMGVIANLPIMLMDMGKNMILKFVDGIASLFGLPKDKIHQIAESVIDVVQALPRALFNWGKEMIENLGKGIESAKDWVIDKVSGLADGIASFLHFTKPDTGPLREYETWMPDFMNGMAKGIHDNLGLLKNASANVASVLTVEPAAPGMAGTSTAIGSGLNELISSLKDSINLTSSGGNQKKGDTIMPIYIGNRLLDEIILDSNARQVVKSGGR